MAGILEEGPIRKLLRERGLIKRSPEAPSLVGPDVSITFLDGSIHFIFHGGALESDRVITIELARKTLDDYIRTLEKDLVILKEARTRVG